MTSTADRTRRSRTEILVRIVGHTAWWVFVVTCMSRDFGPSGPVRYRSYIPLTDVGSDPFASGFATYNTLTVAALLAISVTVIAAILEAILSRNLLVGVATVLTPIVGAILVWFAVDSLRPELAVPLVLLGVAIREVWSRGFAPLEMGMIGKPNPIPPGPRQR